MRRDPRALAAVVAALAVAAPRAAGADEAVEAVPGHRVRPAVDGAVIGVAAAGALAPMLLGDVGPRPPWRRQLLGGLDDRVKGDYSATASRISDGLLVTTIAVPAALLLGDPLDDAARDRFVIYGESLVVGGMLASLTKYAVRRPRPYTYATDPRVVDVVRAAGDDAWLSFYSGHSALAFGAAVTGSYLHGARATDPNARALVWGVELAAAAATANLRVRAGKHFYSDVLVGAVVGAGVGYLVPALHAEDGARYAPSGRDYAAMGLGLAVGLAGSQLLPLRHDVTVQLADEAPSPVTVQLVPTAVPDGAGLAAVGTF